MTKELEKLFDEEFDEIIGAAAQNADLINDGNKPIHLNKRMKFFIDKHYVAKEKKLTCSEVHPGQDVYHPDGHGTALLIPKSQLLEIVGEDMEEEVIDQLDLNKPNPQDQLWKIAANNRNIGYNQAKAEIRNNINKL